VDPAGVAITTKATLKTEIDYKIHQLNKNY